MKRVIASVLVFVMLLSFAGIFAHAEGEAYMPDFDRETPVILLHGIGQNRTYLLDDEGNRMLDENGYELTGRPLEMDTDALLKKIVPHVVLSAVTRSDAGLYDAMREGGYELFSTVHKDNEGNYLNNIEVPCYKCPMSEVPTEVKWRYYNSIPVYEYAREIIGEENLYYFGYDSFGDIEETTKQLHEYITEVVLPQTKSEKVNLCPISLGGTLFVNYLEMYPEDYKYFKNVACIVPAIDGSDIVGDLLAGNLSTYDDRALYRDILVYLLGDNTLTYLAGILLHLLPQNVLKNALLGLSEGAVEGLARNTTQLWALCPDEQYPAARKKWLSDDEHSLIAAKVDYYMNARADFEENLRALEKEGANVYNIACYGQEIVPIAEGYKTTNSDGLIQCESTSMGASFAPLNTALDKSYEPVGTYCSDSTHNHISPDRQIDATTGLLPDRTWYFKGLPHIYIASADELIELAILLLCDDNMTDISSYPERYPQFIEEEYWFADEQYMAEYYARQWEKADKSVVSEKDREKIDVIVAEIEQMKQNNVIDSDRWYKKEKELLLALRLSDAEIRYPSVTTESAFYEIFKAANKVMVEIDTIN